MRRFPPFRRVAAMMLAIALVSDPAYAQEIDTLTISGTFHMDALMYPGIIGADLADVFANGHAHSWTLRLHGVSYSPDYYYAEWDDEWSYGHHEQYITRVHATSFEFHFAGPDADILNEVVSGELANDGAFFELWNGDYLDSAFPDDSGRYSSFAIGLQPPDPATGVSFNVFGYWDYSAQFSTDEYGYPVVEPQRLQAFYSTIDDYRPGNEGGLASFYDFVDIGSSEPPVLPPPPPPALGIADASVQEGNKGSSRLNLTVTLSHSSDELVTVNYATVDGTAVAKSDYTATSGTLTFQPGQTSRTISIAITGDRKREPNETFSVQLSNAAGATIDDGVATATILNDD